MTGFSEPLDGIRDAVAWPVLPVTAPIPLRKVQDLEPYPSEAFRIQEQPEQNPDTVKLSGASREPLVADLMKDEVVTIGPEQSVGELEDLLVRHRISGVPVTEDGILLGVVSQTDLVKHHLGLEKRSARPQGTYHLGIRLDRSHPTSFPPSPARVWEIMTPHTFYATEDATILAVLDMMLRNHIHRVVITRDRRLVGVVTSSDILGHYRQALLQGSGHPI